VSRSEPTLGEWIEDGAALPEALVHCARARDLGCTATRPEHKFGAIRAQEAGWFTSKETGDSFCPDHLPGWVPAWRAKKAVRKFEVDGAYTDLPAVLKCAQGDLADVIQPVSDDAEWQAMVKDLRARAFAHGRETGHVCTVIDARVLTVSPQ
jgi:hypothetical protein